MKSHTKFTRTLYEFRMKLVRIYLRTYAVDRLNVISSDGRSEKSRQSQLVNTGFRDFSSLTCATAGAGRSSK
jgi:hypothetical protein